MEMVLKKILICIIYIYQCLNYKGGIKNEKKSIYYDVNYVGYGF